MRFEQRDWQLDAKHANQTFAYIVARDRRILLLKKIARFRVLINGLCERRAEASQMRSAIRIWDGIRKRQNLIVVAVIVLQNNIGKNFIALSRDHDRLGMQNLFVLTELFYELFDAMLIEKCFLFRRIAAFIGLRDFETGIKKR